MKGSAFEREVCKALSLWWTDGESNKVFARTRGSGAALKRGGSKWEGGDIGFVDPIGEPLVRRLNIEAKTGYAVKTKLKSGKMKESNWCALDIIDSNLKKPMLWKMWDQTRRDAVITGREPILIFRRFRRRTCIAFYTTFYGTLIDYYGFPTLSIPRIQCQWAENNKFVSVNVLLLKDFFEWVPDIRAALEEKPRLYVP